MAKKKNETRNHYLRPIKKILDTEFGKAPLHVCLESGHPATLGRASDLIMKIVQYECFDEIGRTGDDKIHVHFIPDRLSVPELDGHVIAIGGPRSNVVARIGMEYEATLLGDSQFYQRHTNHTFNMDYNHIHRRDYDGRLFSDMDVLDEYSRLIIHHYYQCLQKPPFFDRDGGDKQPKINLFSVNRYMRWRNNNRLPAISARIDEGLKIDGKDISAAADYPIYDHFIETILPNVFSDDWRKRPLIVYHGLRTLGTYTSLLALDDNTFHKNFTRRLKLMREHSGVEGKHPTAKQTGWYVVRPLGPRVGLHEDDRLLDALEQNGGFKLKKSGYDDETLAFKRHEKEENEDVELIDEEKIMLFRKELKERGFDGKQKQTRLGVKIDEIDEEQILDAMSLQRDEFFRRHDVYVLGCFERKKTVYTQQSRALTLVHALCKAGKIKSDTKIGIVGAGVSGISAAIAAREAGARVVLLEKSDKLIPIQRDCDHRTLHPYFYDWPNVGTDKDETEFPIDAMNWQVQEKASEIFKKLRREFKKYRKETNSKGDRHGLTVYKNFEVQGYYYDSKDKKHILSRLEFPDYGKGLNLRRKPTRKRNETGKAFEKRVDAWQKAYDEYDEQFVREAAAAGAREIPEELKETYRWDTVDCDIVIFATGYGEENPRKWLKEQNIHLPGSMLINESYWKSDDKKFPSSPKDGAVYVVSGSGDGALIDILRICIKEFENPEWHAKFIKKMNNLVTADLNGAVWSNRRDILAFAHALKELFNSDRFKLLEGEDDRKAQIERTLAGFEIDSFLDAMAIQLNDVSVQNVCLDPQPFWSESALAHRLLIWCLYKKSKLKFIRGSIAGYEDGALTIERRMMSKMRVFDVEGVVIRHGVGQQNAKFLQIPGLLYNYDKDPVEIARDGQRLISLLRLSNDLHPETEKFFRHTLRNLK